MSDSLIEKLFGYKYTLRFLVMFSLSLYLYHFGFGAWIFIVDIPDAWVGFQELLGKFKKDKDV